MGTNQEIYVEVRHLDFWWGVYGFTRATDWEDLIFYEKQADALVRIGDVCACSRRFLGHGLADMKADPYEKDFAEKIEQFLQRETIVYHYFYSEPNDKDFYEVPFEAQRNDRGIKPCAIDLWYPEDGIDIAAVETCTRAFCEKFLKKHVDTVLLQDAPPFEQAANEYREHAARFRNGPVPVVFTEEVVESLATHWKKPKEEVLKILFRSL